MVLLDQELRNFAAGERFEFVADEIEFAEQMLSSLESCKPNFEDLFPMLLGCQSYLKM